MGNWSEDERGIFPFSFNEARPPLLAANQNVPPSSDDVLWWVIQLFPLSSQIIQRFISFSARFYTFSPNKFRHSSFEFIGRGLSPFFMREVGGVTSVVTRFVTQNGRHTPSNLVRRTRVTCVTKREAEQSRPPDRNGSGWWPPPPPPRVAATAPQTLI